MKQGLVLEGGAMRGMFSAGILDVMMEQGISFDGIVGVSAGAAFGCNYKSGQIGRAIRYNKKYCNDPRYCSFRSLLRTGDLFGAEFCYHELTETLDPFDIEAFCASPLSFYAVCTDVKTGKPVYHKCETADYNDLEWIRASASMPLVSRVVEVDGFSLLDGGISDSIPLAFFQQQGYERNIVILTQPRGYRKEKNSLIPFFKLALRKYPKVVDAMERRHEMYNQTLDYLWEEEKKGAVLVLCPDQKLPVKRIEHKAETLEQVYQIGRRIATERMKKIRDFLRQS